MLESSLARNNAALAISVASPKLGFRARTPCLLRWPVNIGKYFWYYTEFALYLCYNITLKNAYLELMKKKDPCTITVRELCETAGLNRSTFYNRFGYMKALEEKVIRDCLDEVCHTGVA